MVFELPQHETQAPSKAEKVEGQKTAPVEAPTEEGLLRAKQEAEKAAVQAKREAGNTEVQSGTSKKTSDLRDDVVVTAVAAVAKVDEGTKAKATKVIEEEGEGGDWLSALSELGKEVMDIVNQVLVSIGLPPLSSETKTEDTKTDTPTQGKKPKEAPSSWPKPISLEDAEYKDSPITTSKGYPLHLSSEFGMRTRPGKPTRMHEGIDLNYGSGSDDEHLPLYANVSLQVENVYESDSGGYTISLFDPKNPDKVFNCLHLDELPPFERGDLLEPGTCFAKIGGTGTSSEGSHLHLEMKENGKTVDPLMFFGEKFRLDGSKANS